LVRAKKRQKIAADYAFPMPAAVDNNTPERAGDVIGAERPGTWFDLVIARDIRSGALYCPRPLDVIHAWQDIETLAMRFVQVATRERVLPGFLHFNVEGHAVIGTELLQSVERTTFAPDLTTQRILLSAQRHVATAAPC
jgi:hypothetical protein